MENLISIILPVKNTEMYLGECLDSIVNQSYQNWELIAVDDFSDDNCFQILKEYSQNDSRIQTYHNQTSGIIGALNLGYSKSSGVFITRMDSDDIMPADKLLNLKQCLDSGGAGFVATGMVQYFSDLPISDGYQQYEHWLNHLTKTASNFDDIYKECPIASPCWMVSRCDFEKSGGFNSKKYPEDYDLCFRFYRAGFKIKASHQILHLWREYQHRTSRISENYVMDRFTDLKLDYFLNIEVQDQDTIVLWSAGQKSKELAKRLLQIKQNFRWVCTNPKKIGNQIYQVEIEDYQNIPQFSDPKVIVPIAIQKYQILINEFFTSINLVRNQDYFFFS